MNAERTNFVVGFVFDNDGRDVILLEKRRPWWQSGKLNGVGGAIEDGETPLMAMSREAWEEIGAVNLEWFRFAVIIVQDPEKDTVLTIHCFAAMGYGTMRTKTDEPLVRAPYEAVVNDLVPIIPNLRWLLPMALTHMKTPGPAVEIRYQSPEQSWRV